MAGRAVDRLIVLEFKFLNGLLVCKSDLTIVGASRQGSRGPNQIRWLSF